MKKYGQQLRFRLTQQKQTISQPPLRLPAFAFNDDDDDNQDNIEREISRQAAKTKVEERHKKTLVEYPLVFESHAVKPLEEDPSVFEFHAVVYDGIKVKIARPRVQDKTERKSKYVEILMQNAKEQEREREIIYEKKLMKGKSKDDHPYADKEKFVTSAYKKQLAEREKWMEEERLRQICEEKEDITKKEDLSEFYFGLNKNVAFGGGGRLAEPTKPSKPEVAPHNCALGFQGGSATESNQVPVKSEIHYRSKSQTEHEAATSKAVTEDITSSQGRKREANKDKKEKPDQTEEQTGQIAEVYKRSEDAVAAARERFLARKRAREQLLK